MLGRSPEEVIGKKIVEVIGEEGFNAILPHVKAVLSGQRVEYEANVHYKGVGSRWVHVIYTPDKDRLGQVQGWVASILDITERKRSDEHIVALAQEAEHRTRNILATVQATVNLSHSDTPDGLKQAIEGRIQALANVHGLLVKSRWLGAELSRIAAQELAPYLGEGEGRVRIDGPHLVLAPNTAQALAVVLHELATNATKYGCLSMPEGQVAITWSREIDGRLILRWTESGGPPAKKPTHQGFGTSVIDKMIRQQLRGKMHFDWRVEGLVCEIVLKM
jgi:PAS domain S-box-containing protein